MVPSTAHTATKVWRTTSFRRVTPPLACRPASASTAGCQSPRRLDRGSVRVKVRFPWLDCRVGATFPDATLDDAAGRNSFSEVTVTRCDSDAVTLSYAKVTVRGWDPAKKEE